MSPSIGVASCVTVVRMVVLSATVEEVRDILSTVGTTTSAVASVEMADDDFEPISVVEENDAD